MPAGRVSNCVDVETRLASVEATLLATQKDYKNFISGEREDTRKIMGVFHAKFVESSEQVKNDIKKLAVAETKTEVSDL